MNKKCIIAFTLAVDAYLLAGLIGQGIDQNNARTGVDTRLPKILAPFEYKPTKEELAYIRSNPGFQKTPELN